MHAEFCHRAADPWDHTQISLIGPDTIALRLCGSLVAVERTSYETQFPYHLDTDP